MNDSMAGMDGGETSAAKDSVRISPSGEVEVFDGVSWRIYEQLTSADPGPVIRDE